MNEIKKVQLKTRPLQAVQFTGDNAEWVKEWVQGHTAFSKVVANKDRLYLPTAGGMDILEPGDWVLYDPEDNGFRGATNDAIESYYDEIEE